MSMVKMKHIKQYRDRHGKRRYYLRQPGRPSVPLPGLPGSPEFMAAYAAGERPILARGLDYSSEEVYTYVQRVAQQYRAELGRKGGR